MYRTINNSNNNDIEGRKGQYRIEKQGTEQKRTEQKENRTKKGWNRKGKRRSGGAAGQPSALA